MCLLIGADSVYSVYVAAGYLLVFVGLLTFLGWDNDLTAPCAGNIAA